MTARARKTVQLGEVIVTAFDNAALCSSDSAEVSRLATRAIALMLRSLQRPLTSRRARAPSFGVLNL